MIHNVMSMPFNFDEEIERRGTGCIKYDGLNYFFGEKDALPFWVADMDFKVPECIVKAIRERAEHAIFGYPLQSESLFEEVVRWILRRWNWKINPEWMVYAPGVVPALNLAVLAFSEPGDKIIVQPPVYFPFFAAVKDHHRVLLHNTLVWKENGYDIHWTQFEEFARQGSRMLILCHPHNPVGRCWKKSELETLSTICEKYGVLVLSDEIHADLNLWGKPHIPLASVSKYFAENSITFLSASKTFNLAGLSSAFVVLPDPGLREKFKAELDKFHIGMGNIFGLVATETAFREGEPWLRDLIKYLEGNFQYLQKYLQERHPTVKVCSTEATYLAWLDFRGLGIPQAELKKRLLREAGLALNDGSMFGPGGEGFMRWNFACPRKRLEQGLDRLKRVIP